MCNTLGVLFAGFPHKSESLTFAQADIRTASESLAILETIRLA